MLSTIYFVQCKVEHSYCMPLMHFVAIKSAILQNNPKKTFLYTAAVPCGFYWDQIKHSVNVVKVDNKEDINPTLLTDILRRELLYNNGGVYFDLDTISLAPVPEDVKQSSLSVGRMMVPKGSYLDGPFLSSQPKNSFLYEWLLRLYHLRDHGFRTMQEFLIKEEELDEDEDRLYILPSKRAFPIHGHSYPVKRFLLYGEGVYPETFVVHFWETRSHTSSWMECFWKDPRPNWINQYISWLLEA